MLDFFPLRLLLATFAGWVNRRQAEVVAYLLEESRVLKEQLCGKRLRFNNDQRRRIAVKGKVLGRDLLAKVATIVTPDTILRWHHLLIAAKWTHKTKRVGRPGIMKAIRELLVWLVTDNSGWGYRRTVNHAPERVAGSGVESGGVRRRGSLTKLPASRPYLTPEDKAHSQGRRRARSLGASRSATSRTRSTARPTPDLRG